ncbi:hypothetical protein [Paraburkholderia sp. SIMBA_054]|uniref:hypothetical protein n=1 Tax=Paraburkholderia sp. SIMBA_054 TaxID=3085795 RepID=UPI00397917A6
MTKTIEHKALVELGARHVKQLGFPVIATELRAWGTNEEADVIGFRASSSILIEAKCSRSDFLADARKPVRSAGGLGVYRFYLCPANLIQAEEVPDRWGLLWVQGKKVVSVKAPRGNLWPPYDPSPDSGDWSHFMHEPSLKAERAVLFSIARRRSLSRTEEKYEAAVHRANLTADRLARANDSLANENRDLALKLSLATLGANSEPNAVARPSRAIPRRRIRRADDLTG